MAGVSLKVVVAALALSGAMASVAHADPLAIDPSKSTIASQWAAPLTQHKTFEYDAAKSRWGFKFDVEQQPGLGTEWKSAQAGAFFKVTPSLRVGAGVALSDNQNPPNSTGNALAQPPVPPRIHLETTLKF
jgi:hypothetical protein